MAKLKGKDFMIGAVSGAVFGAVTALLLAPKSGKELRGDIAEQYNHVSQKTQKIAGQVSKTSQEWAHKAKELAGNVVGEIKSWSESRKEAAASSEVLDKAE